MLFHDFFSLARTKSVAEFIEFTDRRNKVIKAWYKEVRVNDITFLHLTIPSAKVWDEYGFDAIIAPVQALPTIPHG